MAFNLTQTLINSHLVSGNMQPGNEIALRIDQALLQDVLGTLVMLELEAMRVERVRIDRAVQYVDHNLLETDNLNGDEHLFLRSACRRFGIWYSRPGNGISHPVHMQRNSHPPAKLAHELQVRIRLRAAQSVMHMHRRKSHPQCIPRLVVRRMQKPEQSHRIRSAGRVT